MTTETKHPGAHKFVAFELAIDIVAGLREVVEVIRKRDRDTDLARQIVRAASSIAANLAEAGGRQGKDRLHHFRIAAGSTHETGAHLRVAMAWGWIQQRDIESVLRLLEREKAGSHSVGKSPQQGELAIDQRHRWAHIVSAEPSPRECNSQVDARLFRTASCVAKEAHSVFTMPAISFGEVGGDRRCRSHDLLGYLVVVSSNHADDVAQGDDDLDGYFERNERLSSGSFRFCGHAPSGAGGVTTRHLE